MCCFRRLKMPPRFWHADRLTVFKTKSGWFDDFVSTYLYGNYSEETKAEVVRTVMDMCVLIPITQHGNDHLSRMLWGEQDEGGDQASGGKTTSGSEQDWTFQRHKWLWTTDRDGGSWLRYHRRCPYDPPGQWTDTCRSIDGRKPQMQV